MSLILEGIDLPTDRKPYGIEVIYRFEGADGLFSEKNYLSPNQAIQIPKGHGRLIDVSDLYICGSDSYEQRMIDEGIADAPTILEAEGEEDEQPRG